jgi:hypothetical protein
MEKIKVIDLGEQKVSKNNKKYHIVKLDDGRLASVWDGDIIERIIANVGTEADAEIKEQNGYNTITEFKGKTTMTSENPVITENDTPTRDTTIVAQCLTKCVFGDKGGSKEEVLDTYKFYLKELA